MQGQKHKAANSKQSNENIKPALVPFSHFQDRKESIEKSIGLE